MKNLSTWLKCLLVCFVPLSTSLAADTNTVSSTVVTDKTPPTASAPSVVINNSDVCKSAASAAIQTQILGFASGITVTDENCERLKLARSVYGMGMKVAAISMLCQDFRVFDAMMHAGTPCHFVWSPCVLVDCNANWSELSVHSVLCVCNRDHVGDRKKRTRILIVRHPPLAT